MGPGRAPGRAAEADRRPFFHRVSPFDQELGHVPVGAEDAEAVVDDDRLAAEVEVAGHDHPSRIGHADPLAERRADVEPGVDGCEDVVVEAPLTEIRP